MTKKVLRIGCDYFDLMGKKSFRDRPVFTKRLGDVYKTASRDKIASWNRWVLFFEDDILIHCETYGIIGANTWQYSIGGVIYSVEHDKYFEIKITKNNRYAWELV